MGRALGVALTGLRARAGASLALLLLLVVALAAAVVGPVFLRAADESAVRQAVLEGPPAARLVSIESTETAAHPAAVLEQSRRLLVATPVLRDVLGEAVTGGQAETTTGQGDVLPVVWRSGLCDHVRITAGRCPSAPGEVVMADPLPAPEGWRVGAPAVLTPGGAVTVVGTYAPIDVADPYWAGRGYDPVDGVGDPADPRRRVGAAFTVPATLGQVTDDGGRERDVLDVPVDPERVTAGNADALAHAVAGLTDRLFVEVPQAQVGTALPRVLATAAQERSGLRLPVLLVVAQLLLVSLLVLGLVVEGTAGARAPEVALARLRGLGPWRVAATGLLEVVLLVLAALPPALGAGVLAAHLAASGRLVRGTPVVLTTSGVLAGAAAVAVAVLVAAWAGREALRTPATELLRTGPPRRRSGWGGLLAVLALAAAGAAELGRGGGGLGSDRLDVVSLGAPGALALAVALLGARLLPLLCRLLLPVTRVRGPVPVFLAVRQLARRPAGARSLVVVTAALGLAAFAVFASSVQAQNRHDRALADNGAPTAYAARPDPGVDLQAAVRAADPGGHAMAVVQYDSPDSGPGQRRLLAVDSSRLARVAFRRGDLGTPPPGALARALAPPAAAPVRVQGDAVRVVLDVLDRTPPPAPALDGTPPAPEADPPTLSLELDGAGGQRRQLDLGPVRDSVGGSRTVTLPVEDCAASPCRLRGLRVARQLSGGQVVVGLTVRALSVHGATGWTDSDAVAQPGRWRTEEGSGTVQAGPGGALAVQLVGDPGQQPVLAVADHPVQLPAVVTGTRFRPQGQLRVPALDGQDTAASEVAVARFLPGAGSDAALADLTEADRATGAVRSGLATSAVWAAPGAPRDLAARLAARGVRVVAASTAAQREAALARQGPALAVRLLLLAGVVATVLAGAGVALSLALLGRRRRYELAALQAAGLPARSLTVSVLAEQVALLSAGAVLGLAAGLAGGALAIRSVPQFDDVDPGLPLLTAPRPGALAVLLGAAVLVVLAAALLSGGALVRGRGPERLREAQT